MISIQWCIFPTGWISSTLDRHPPCQVNKPKLLRESTWHHLPWVKLICMYIYTYYIYHFIVFITHTQFKTIHSWVSVSSCAWRNGTGSQSITWMWKALMSFDGQGPKALQWQHAWRELVICHLTEPSGHALMLASHHFVSEFWFISHDWNQWATGCNWDNSWIMSWLISKIIYNILTHRKPCFQPSGCRKRTGMDRICQWCAFCCDLRASYESIVRCTWRRGTSFFWSQEEWRQI